VKRAANEPLEVGGREKGIEKMPFFSLPAENDFSSLAVKIWR
jgi:hypothetical protein